MLDVIHVLFEDDLLPTWEHGAETKSKVREAVYSSMYGIKYKYGYSATPGGDPEWELGGIPDPVNAPDGTVKPYIPPSTDAELSAILDAPMGE